MKPTIFLAATLLCAVPIHAAQVQLDPGKSSLNFTGHTFLHDFKGGAKKFTGIAQIDPQRPELIVTARIDIEAAQLTTHKGGRDRKMYQWLQVTTNPEIIFEVTRILSMDGKAATATKDHPAQFIVFGNLTLNKTTKVLQSQVTGWRDDHLLVVTGTTEINTTDYGLPLIKRFWMTVDKEVEIKFRLSFNMPPQLRPVPQSRSDP